jgi:actin-like ATPase involved in cell morphogenesis
MNFLGIDFGTSSSSMAWFNPRTGQAEVLRNAQGDEKTPSVVYYGDGEVLVGREAELRLEDLALLSDPAERAREGARVVRSVKRQLGDRRLLAVPGRPDVRPVEVAAEVLRKLRHDAEEGHFHEPVEDVVLTCPAIFDAVQRDALVEAARLAGFARAELVDEPVAAALAYVQAGQKVGDDVLVYDLGGGTFDLALVTREPEGGFRLALETDGDPRCGGDDLDEALYGYWDAQVQALRGRPIGSDGGSLDPHFLLECRRRKEQLSVQERPLSFSWLLPDGGGQKLTIDRPTFERLARPLIERTVRKVQSLLVRAREAGCPPQTVVLIGGAAKVPLVKQALAAVLPSEPRSWQLQDLAVALGAAWHPLRGVRRAAVPGDAPAAAPAPAPAPEPPAPPPEPPAVAAGRSPGPAVAARLPAPPRGEQVVRTGGFLGRRKNVFSEHAVTAYPKVGPPQEVRYADITPASWWYPVVDADRGRGEVILLGRGAPGGKPPVIRLGTGGWLPFLETLRQYTPVVPWGVVVNSFSPWFEGTFLFPAAAVGRTSAGQRLRLLELDNGERFVPAGRGDAGRSGALGVVDEDEPFDLSIALTGSAVEIAAGPDSTLKVQYGGGLVAPGASRSGPLRNALFDGFLLFVPTPKVKRGEAALHFGIQPLVAGG